MLRLTPGIISVAWPGFLATFRRMILRDGSAVLLLLF
jgi:hypothetical protein